jgi:segregation and condensation protein A
MSDPQIDSDPESGLPPAALAAFSSSYSVRVDAFEGPLDLLLHLARINEVEITDIPIAEIAGQYLEYLSRMREQNLDIAAEYLVMAATLAWIKSRMLLPPDGTSDEDEGPDPRAELIARLLEYQRFKEASAELGDRHLLGRDVFAARAPSAEPVPESAREIEVGVYELVEAYRRVLARPRHSGRAHEVEVESVTVQQRMHAVMELLAARESIDFDALILDGEGHVHAIPVVVATFLAILELTRLGFLRLYQGIDEAAVPQGAIHCRRAVDPGSSDWTERIAEVM